MHLVMFDLDGTLVDSHAIDEPCYLQALVDVFNFDLDLLDRDWGNYPHVTDAGILNSICWQMLGRLPTIEEINGYQNRFLELLEIAVLKNPLQQIFGVQNLLDCLSDSGDCALALATGAWAQTAQFKLHQTDLDRFDFSAAYSDDAYARIEIMKCAYQRSLDRGICTTFDRVTYIGDGVWDGIASQQLGYRFIGIGNRDRASDLLAVGAELVFPDYQNLEAMISAIASA